MAEIASSLSPDRPTLGDPVRTEHADGRRRILFIRWLRHVHGWIGLWGAALGLLFGSTGILLNHRAVLRIPAAQAQVSTVQIPLPRPAPADTAAMDRWLRQHLELPRPAQRVRQEPARPVAWGDRRLIQPAHWTLMFATPREIVQADWWVGNGYVSVRRSANNVWATLMNLHKGVGMGVGWILLVDTLAGSIILLSLSGLLLWTRLDRRRLFGFGITAACLALTTTLALRSM